VTADPEGMSTTLGRGATSFDYEAKTWGGHDVKLSPTYLGALRLRYCLEDLKGVRGRVVEVGCGGGGMARALKAYRPELKVLGCDLSKKAIRLAGRKSRDLELTASDAYNLPYASGSIAAYIMFDVLEHVEDPRQVLAEANRVLEQDGVLHVFVPCEGELHTLHGLLARVGWRAKEHYGGHIQRFTLADLKQLLASVGFTNARSRWSCHAINQLADVGYFTALQLKGKNTAKSVEGFLATSRRGLPQMVVWGMKAGVSVASYLESRLLSWLPGSGAHLSGRKNGRTHAN